MIDNVLLEPFPYKDAERLTKFYIHDSALALGAQRSTVLKMLLRRGLTMIAADIAIGELVSLALTRLLQNQLWGVSSHDPAPLGGVVGVFIAVGIAACTVPTRRATRVDPMVALRYE